jgi:hypothetical protein
MWQRPDVATTQEPWMQRLKLEWWVIDKDHVGLIFDKATWKLLQDEADSRDMEPTDMVAGAVATLLGRAVRV